MYRDDIHPNAAGAKELSKVLKALLCDSTCNTPRSTSNIKIEHTDFKSAKGNRFQGYAARVSSIDEVRYVLSELYTNSDTNTATSIMYAYKLSNEKGTSDCFDDREHKAGAHIMNCIEKTSATNLIVAVSRDYACHIFGERWSIIHELACDAINMIDPEKTQEYSHRNQNSGNQYRANLRGYKNRAPSQLNRFNRYHNSESQRQQYYNNDEWRSAPFPYDSRQQRRNPYQNRRPRGTGYSRPPHYYGGNHGYSW